MQLSVQIVVDIVISWPDMRDIDVETYTDVINLPGERENIPPVFPTLNIAGQASRG